MARVKIFGYAEEISVAAGDPMRIMVSAEGTSEVKAHLVRLIHGDCHPSGPGFVEKEIDSELNGPCAVRKQYTQLGSFARVEDSAALLDLQGSFTLHAFVWPSSPHLGRRQGILSRWRVGENVGYGIGLNGAGILEFWVGDGKDSDSIVAEVPLVPRIWYFVAATFEHRSRTAMLYQEAVINSWNSNLSAVVPLDYASHVKQRLRRRPDPREVPFLLAGCSERNKARGEFVSLLFNGKIDRCGVQGRVLSRLELDRIRDGGEPPPDGLIARWDTTAGYTREGIGDRIVDVGPNGLHAEGVNKPVRGMTGYNWNGRTEFFAAAPEQYGGIHFHDDAVIDCGWEPSLKFTLPELRSGCYAVRLRADGAEEYVPFFVRTRSPKARIAMLMPTASYLAYGNEHLAFDFPVAQVIVAHTPILADPDVELYKEPDFGLSTYDYHSDGAGVCYASYRRPIINMRPKHRTPAIGVPWQFPADLSIIAWLEHKGYDYDVITDHDLHRDGLAALEPYKVVLTGTHPEYYSERMLDATEQWVASGGRLMYMGGNGYYWVVSFPADQPWCMEVRKGEGGTRAWQARPGEYYHSTSGERGGLWRYRGRSPQKATGVGFASEGFDRSSHYRRMPDSHHPSASWIFEGVEGETFGHSGLGLGAAAGLEIDRYDRALGTPPHTKLLASSEDHSDGYPLVVEEIMAHVPGLAGTLDPRVRADVTYFEATKGGAVFCTGSIAWGQALPYNGFDNDISTITANVVDAFAADGPLPGASAGGAGTPMRPEAMVRIADRQRVYVGRFHRRMRKALQGLVNEEMIEEYRRTPLGRHSDTLDRILQYFSKPGVQDGYAILEVAPGADYRVVILSGIRGLPPTEADGSYESLEQAYFAVFLRRLGDLVPARATGVVEAQVKR